MEVAVRHRLDPRQTMAVTHNIQWTLHRIMDHHHRHILAECPVGHRLQECMEEDMVGVILDLVDEVELHSSRDEGALRGSHVYFDSHQQMKVGRKAFKSSNGWSLLFSLFIQFLC